MLRPRSLRAAFRTTAFVLVAAVAPQAVAQALPDNTPVRFQASGLGAGWLEGKLRLNKPSGCTMVFLDRKTSAGYTSATLNALQKLERKEGGTWVDVPLKPLLAREPTSCRKAAND
jgi:hypothetical protein